MSSCIFPGRFQPFHNGHLMVVQGMMNTCGKATVVICCDPDGSPGKDAMFSLEEVREMISAALLESDIVDAAVRSFVKTSQTGMYPLQEKIGC